MLSLKNITSNTNNAELEQLIAVRRRLAQKIAEAAQDKAKAIGVKQICLEKADIHFKNWAKIVTHLERNIDGRDAFQGEYIKIGCPMNQPIGTFILCFKENRGGKTGEINIQIYRVVDNQQLGNLVLTYQKRVANDHNWVATIIDDVEKILNVS